MKNTTRQTKKTAIHFVPSELIRPYNPVTVNLISAGGTGGQVLTALARMNHALIALGHAGLFVQVFDDDKVDTANLGRQLFTTAELGQYKAVALTNRINRFFGTNWKANTIRYDHMMNTEASANITISCVDTVAARFEIADILDNIAKHNHGRSRPLYWMDFGNGKSTGQVVLSTIGSIRQPTTKEHRTVDRLPLVTKEFGDLLNNGGQDDGLPSCSMAEALSKQDLFINSALANCGASLLWQLFREGKLLNRGFFLNLQDFRAQPLSV